VITIVTVFVFLIGLCIGSFLNVVIYRYNTGRGVNGRSGCMHCGKTLAWYELIPVISFLLQGGRCSKCSSKLSWQYPLVELSTAILFVATFYKYLNIVTSPSIFILLAISLVAWCLLVVIVVYDIKHKIIPDGLVYTFAALGLLRVFIFVPVTPAVSFYTALLAGPILFLPFFLLWFISDGRWIGLGDGKLALGIGWMLGLGLGLSAIVLSFWIGAIVSIGLMLFLELKLKGKHLTMKSEIPFAPFLIVGFAIVYFLSIDVLGLETILKSLL
jgi:prepilin signal peptidase PulO-like enzyme (type II secretory pathway)